MLICISHKQACKATKKFQEEVFDLISQLPEKVEIVSEYSELYNLDAKLQRATNELYCDILWAMEGLIYWLTKDHTCMAALAHLFSVSSCSLGSG